jgi:hypothetical protein
MDGYPKLEVQRKTGDECFHIGSEVLNRRLADFWAWSVSDLVSNATRGRLAEYIVALAVGSETGVRAEWDAFDIESPSGIKIEVKSAAYPQSWHHKRLSSISFGIRPTRGWNPDTNLFSETLQRQCDVYVFCLLHHQDKATLDPLDLSQWTFYVLSAAVLDQRCRVQKTISLSHVLKLDLEKGNFNGLSAMVSKAATQGVASEE